MILALCVDDRMGLSLKGRRLSKDSALREKLWALSGGALRTSEYSARQFEQAVYTGKDYLSGAKQGDWCFLENADYQNFADAIEKIVLFRWNRHYPSDLQFRFPGKWRLVSSEDFHGTSHDKLTMEVYKRCE